MTIEISNARVIDPTSIYHGLTTTLYVEGEKFVDPSQLTQAICERIDLQGALTLAGGIDIHTHIGGGKVNIARLLMSDVFAESERVVWPTAETSAKYTRMGYTACFEPAMLLSSARHTLLELADTPSIDTGAYVVLGNEDWLLQAMADGVSQEQIDALVGWSVLSSRALAVKVVNAGGINAFRFGQRMLDVDAANERYGVTPRQIIQSLAASVDRLGIEHPLHVHASNLGMPGNIESTIQTLEATEGRRVHLTHAQFNCYSSDGPMGMGSGAERLAQYVNDHANVSLDVGHVVFGQTVTLSADIAAQSRNRRFANPKVTWLADLECQGGCGAVPIKYQDTNYVHSLQWAIGLELMLLIKDPWRIFLTTDHPNGGPFTSYPHLMRLLMDRSFRAEMLAQVHPLVCEKSLLRELDRELTLDEIAIMTRAAPAKILGLSDQGRIAPGMTANLAAYDAQSDWEATFTTARCVMKNGQVVFRNGDLCSDWERLTPKTHYESAIEVDCADVQPWLSRIQNCLRIAPQLLQITDEELDHFVHEIKAARHLDRLFRRTPIGGSAK